ncbi:hypothetical protein [Niabella beijingensis]|uniref:hypothetical protein n=1 Tax=Niabella beijingensis TaxID=2872700 RepID=UPI001CBC4BE2|nr:hypothetical protein [Niabella beijingensis]MBZ4190047.1 hypothetical protein [Niabella beijingensis]
MVKLLTVFCCLLFVLDLSAQSDTTLPRINDYISLRKKNGIAIDNYYTGMPIHFIGADGQDYEGPIARIAHDSVFVNFYHITKQPTIWGNYIVDTISTTTIPFYYKEIKHIISYRSLKRRGYLHRLGIITQIGGAGYMILNTVNTLKDGDKLFSARNSRNLGIAAAIFGAGWLMNRQYRQLNKISKKYRIVYVDMQ